MWFRIFTKYGAINSAFSYNPPSFVKNYLIFFGVWKLREKRQFIKTLIIKVVSSQFVVWVGACFNFW